MQPRKFYATSNEGIFYTSSKNFNLVGYSYSDWDRDLDERKRTTIFVFFFYERYIFHMVIQEAIDSNVIKL
jgi:hypothetical protein